MSSLASKFGIQGHVEVTTGKGGLPKVVLKHACGSKAEVCGVVTADCPRHSSCVWLQVYLFGATITSWTQPSGDEVLYVRPDAKFDKSKVHSGSALESTDPSAPAVTRREVQGISGGIPHCFPQFGPGRLPQHGFARNCDWEIASTAADLQPDERDPEVELVLTDSDYTRKIWHAHQLAVSSSRSLTCHRAHVERLQAACLQGDLHSLAAWRGAAHGLQGGQHRRPAVRVHRSAAQLLRGAVRCAEWCRLCASCLSKSPVSQVLDVTKAKVLGLNNLKHLDKVCRLLLLPTPSGAWLPTSLHLAQTVDVNNPAERFLKTDGLTFEGPWDSIFVNPPEHIELDVGSGAPGLSAAQSKASVSSTSQGRACLATCCQLHRCTLAS